MEKEKILVSACFVSEGYKYSGGANINEKVLKLKEKYDFILICPEVFGGLPTPRVPSEIIGDKVMNSIGEDVTLAFHRGADMALELAKKHNCKIAVLKAKSPSCGKGYIYDGSFTHTTTSGHGVAAKLLMDNGIVVYTEDEVDNL
jgi:uncharacterized protein YbbK (DUF523 family)